MRFFPVVVTALAAGVGCAYTTQSGLPPEVRTIRMEVFENRTGYPGLEARFSGALVRAFQRDGRLAVAGGAADAVLKGRLVAHERSVLQEDKFDDVITGKVVVRAVISLEALSGTLLREESVSSGDIWPHVGVYYLRRGRTEGEARAGAIEELAEAVVRRVVELW